MADTVKTVSPPVADVPKKKAASKPKAPATHPKYSEMVDKALSEIKERGGSSRQAILKYIMANFKVNDDDKKVNTHLKLALRAGVKNGSLVQPKGSGASGSFKLNVEAKKKVEKKPKEKAATPKKATTPKKPAAKKKATEKKTGEKKAKPATEKKAKPGTEKKAKPAGEKTAVKKKSPKKSPKKAAASEKKSRKPAVAKKPKTPKKAAPKKTAPKKK